MSTISSQAAAREVGLKAVIRRYPLLSMYALIFVLAWSVMIPQALYSQGILASPLPETLEILTGWAPAIAAITVSAVLAGRAGVSSLLRRFLIWRVGFRYYLLALFLLAGVILGGIGLHVLMGGDMPAIPAAGAPVTTIALSFILLLVVGSIFNTEEVAWRGFALPRLQARHKVLVASLLLAIPETLLHLPNFWIKDNPFYSNVGLLWFSAFTLAAVFIYTYLFNKTKGSLLLVTLLHASQNAWANLLSDNSARPFYFTVAIMWMIALALILTTKGQLGYQRSTLSESER
jgi:membrane protease YdiL (CAAX protease family)